MTEPIPSKSIRPWPTANRHENFLHQVAFWSLPLYTTFTCIASYWSTHQQLIRGGALYCSQGALLAYCCRRDRENSYRLAGKRFEVLTENINFLNRQIVNVKSTQLNEFSHQIIENLDDRRRRDIDEWMQQSGFCAVADRFCYPVTANPITRLRCNLNNKTITAKSLAECTDLLQERKNDLKKASITYYQQKRDPRATAYYRNLFGLVTIVASLPLLRKCSAFLDAASLRGLTTWPTALVAHSYGYALLT